MGLQEGGPVSLRPPRGCCRGHRRILQADRPVQHIFGVEGLADAKVQGSGLLSYFFVTEGGSPRGWEGLVGLQEGGPVSLRPPRGCS